MKPGALENRGKNNLISIDNSMNHIKLHGGISSTITYGQGNYIDYPFSACGTNSQNIIFPNLKINKS